MNPRTYLSPNFAISLLRGLSESPGPRVERSLRSFSKFCTFTSRPPAPTILMAFN